MHEISNEWTPEYEREKVKEGKMSEQPQEYAPCEHGCGAAIPSKQPQEEETKLIGLEAGGRAMVLEAPVHEISNDGPPETVMAIAKSGFAFEACERISQAHNAALAAEQDKYRKALQ